MQVECSNIWLMMRFHFLMLFRLLPRCMHSLLLHVKWWWFSWGFSWLLKQSIDANTMQHSSKRHIHVCLSCCSCKLISLVIIIIETDNNDVFHKVQNAYQWITNYDAYYNNILHILEIFLETRYHRSRIRISTGWAIWQSCSSLNVIHFCFEFTIFWH